MKTSGAIAGLAGLGTLAHGTTAFLSKDPNSLEGCDFTCKQRILYTNIDSAARIGVSLVEDAYNSAEWCVSEDWCSRTIDFTCNMITRRLIEAAHDVLKNNDKAEFWENAEKSLKRATYWGADWGSRVLNRTSEEKGINSEAMERLNRTLKNFPYAPERSVVNRKALEEEMRKPLSAEDSSAVFTPSMRLKNLAPSGSITSPDMLEIEAEGGGSICGIVPQFSTHWDGSWGHVTVDLCAQSTRTTDPHHALTASHLVTTKSSASADNSTRPSVPATTTIQDTPAASNQTTGSLVTAILPNGSTAIVTAILPAATFDASSATVDAVGTSDSASLSSTSALHSTASTLSEKSTPATPTTGNGPTVTTKPGRPAGTRRPSANTTALTTTSSANDPSSSSVSSSESSVRATRSSSHVESTSESRTSFSSRTTSDAITASPRPTATLSASGGTAYDSSSSPSRATASTQSSPPARTLSVSGMPLSGTANASSSSHVGSTTSAASAPIHSDSSSLHSNTERTAATIDHSSAASSAQNTAASSPSDSGPQPSQSPSHGSSGGDGGGGDGSGGDDDDDDDDHLGLGLGVGLGIGSLLVGGAIWALGNYLHTGKMLGVPLKHSVLEGFSFLKHLFRAKDETVRRMANPNSSTERFLREPGQRAMDLTNYRYERLIQDRIEQGHDYLRQIPDFRGTFEPERADTLPDGTRFDNGLRRTYRIERFSARSGLLENVYVRPADIDYTRSDYDYRHSIGYRRFVWTDERGEPLPPFNYNNGTSTGRYRYLYAQPSDLRLIDLDQEWQNVRSRFVRPRDADGPIIQYLSKPNGAAIGDTLSSQPILQLDGESIIVDAVARVQDQFGDTVAAEMIAPEYSSEKLRNLLNERKYLVTWNASGHGDVELISREDFLNRPGKPVLRKPLQVSEEYDYGWGHHGPVQWPGHGLDMYGYPIPGSNGTSPTYSSLLSTVTPSIETTYLSTDYTTRTHYVNFTTSYESTEYSTRTHVVDLTTQYESIALSTHFVTASMSAPTTLATIGR